MLHKESAIAVMVAVMLGAASIFAGLPTITALATHDSDAIQIASQTISQDEDESTVIDALELTAKKSTSRTTGTVTIQIIQDDDVLRSATLNTSVLSTVYTDVEAQLTNINVTGSFEILVEYEGSGTVTVNDIDIIEGTEAAEEQPNNGGDNEPNNPPDTPEQELENIIASKTLALASDETMTIEAVEFSAKKSTSRSTGTLTVAIVQDDEVLDTEQISTKVISTTMSDIEIPFNDLNVTDDFQVVFMYEGSGLLTIRNIDVPGTTEPAEEEPPTTPPNPDGTVTLTVKAIDQNSAELTELLWFVVNNGATEGGWAPETFVLRQGTYTLATDDYFDDSTQTMYTFVQWTDGVTTKSRTVELSSGKTFTAKFNVVGDAAPPTNNPPPDSNSPPDNNPPPSGPGTLTVFAHRIPSEHWGTSTFTGANAAMWFVLYNSTGWLVTSNFFDENGTTVTGLNDGETYYIYATDCDECHGSTHDVVFDHWEDNSTENPRGVTTGTSSHAYYAYDPDP